MCSSSGHWRVEMVCVIYGSDLQKLPLPVSMLSPASWAWCRQVRRIWKVSVEDGRGTSRKKLGSLNHCLGENYLLTRVSVWTFFFLNVWAIHRFGVTIIIYQSLTETDIRSRTPYFPAPHAECSQVTKFWPMRDVTWMTFVWLCRRLLKGSWF